MRNLFKKIIALICAISFMIIPIPTMAEEGAKIVAGTASGYEQSTVYVDVTAKNLKELASLDIDIFYNSNVLTLEYVTEENIFGAQIDINTPAVGIIKMSMASILPISGDQKLLTLALTIKEGAVVGDYPINIAVGDAYDSLRKPLSVGRESGKVSVLKKQEYIPQAYFYSYADNTGLEEGDETTITYYSYSHYDMASGIFEFSYDPELLEFVEFGLYDCMKTADAYYSDNSGKGYVKVAYSSSTAVGYGDLFYATFRAIKNCDATSDITMSASSLYAQNLSVINGKEIKTNIGIREKHVEPEQPDYADFWVEVSEDVIEGKEFEAITKLSGDFSIAAADFTVNYNSEDFECVSVTVHSDVTKNGGTVVINPKYSFGNIKFSFVNEDGAKDEQKLIVIKFKPIKSGEYSSPITTFGKSVYDENYKLINLDYLETLINVSAKELSGIEITTEPEKKEYLEAKDVLDVESGKLTLTYNNYTTEVIAIYPEMVSGFDNTKIGKQTLTVSYGGFSDTYEIEVLEKSLARIEVTTAPKKLQYIENFDELDLTGGKLTLIYDNDSTEVIDLTKEMISGFDNSVLGEQKITVTHLRRQTDFVVTIIKCPYGDINEDGNIDIKDVHLARLCAAKLHKFNEKQFYVGDVDGDRKITAIDANLIRKFAVKIIDIFPVENRENA